MKIGIIFIGAVRECLNSINDNILCLKQCFSEHDVKIIFSAWLPQKGSHEYCGINYMYDYDIKELEKQIDETVDEILLFPQRDLNSYPKCKNGSPPIFAYHLIEVSKHLKNVNADFDFVVRSRHDILMNIQNPQKYLNSNINIPLIYWNQNKHHDSSKNDHFFITSFENFIKLSEISEEQMNHYCNISVDNENLNFNMLKDISNVEHIDDEDITEYTVRDVRHHKIT